MNSEVQTRSNGGTEEEEEAAMQPKETSVPWTARLLGRVSENNVHSFLFFLCFADTTRARALDAVVAGNENIGEVQGPR